MIETRQLWERLRVKADREMDPLELSLLASMRDRLARMENLMRQAMRAEYDRSEQELSDEWLRCLDDKQ